MNLPGEKGLRRSRKLSVSCVLSIAKAKCSVAMIENERSLIGSRLLEGMKNTS